MESARPGSPAEVALLSQFSVVVPRAKTTDVFWNRWILMRKAKKIYMPLVVDVLAAVFSLALSLSFCSSSLVITCADYIKFPLGAPTSAAAFSNKGPLGYCTLWPRCKHVPSPWKSRVNIASLADLRNTLAFFYSVAVFNYSAERHNLKEIGRRASAISVGLSHKDTRARL